MKNLHNIFKKVSHGAGNVFKKASDVGEDVFKKTSENVLGKVSKISGKIASSPITQALPFGSTIASGAGMISQASRLGAKGAGQLSDVSDLSKYKKGGVRKQLENISDIQKRGQEIAKTGEELRSVFA
jgi:hypothetical protein